MRAFVVDDHRLIRVGITASLRMIGGFDEIFDAENGYDLLRKLNKSDPVDVIFMDLSMPFMDGLTATKEVLKRYPSTRVIVVSVDNHKVQIMKAIQAGALGYLLKEADNAEIKMAVDSAMENSLFMPQKVLDELQRIDPKNIFSERQLEVLQLMADGLPLPKIAKRLFVETSTIKSHRISLLNRAGVNSTAELLVYAAKNGLV